MKKVIFCISGGILSLFLSGCILFSTVCNLKVVLPIFPAHWKERFSHVIFSVYYFDQAGTIKEKSIDSQGKSIEIELFKEINTPILAVPTVEGIDLPPAGGVFPFDLDSANTHTIMLSWEKGFVASLLLDCIKVGADISFFNEKRLSSEIVSIVDDPWKLDYAYIVERILSGNFCVYDIKKLPTRSISFYPGSGNWFIASPFSTIYSVAENDLLKMESIPVGYHRFFCLESKERYDIFIDLNGFTILKTK